MPWPLLYNIIRRNLVNHTFGMVRRNANGTRRPHQGWDFHAPIGTPTWAIADGRVVFIRNEGDYGRQVCIEFRHLGKTYYAFYAHLDSILVRRNQQVAAFDSIGTTGETGNAAGMAKEDQHLHFEIRTEPYPGKGLNGRVSPATIYGRCPLRVGEYQFPPMVIKPRRQ